MPGPVPVPVPIPVQIADRWEEDDDSASVGIGFWVKDGLIRVGMILTWEWIWISNSPDWDCGIDVIGKWMRMLF